MATAKESLEGDLVGLMLPLLTSLEEHVNSVTRSQLLLKNELDGLLLKLGTIKDNHENDSFIHLLEEKSKKLLSLKRRLTLIHTILQNSNERTKKIISTHKLDL